MRTITLSRLDGPAAYEVIELPRPERGRDEVLIGVSTLAPAFPDLLLSRGQYQVKPELPFSPGSDFAGIVLDPGTSDLAAGQRVACCVLYGAAAEVVSVPAALLFPLPDSLDLVDAAALPMNYLTAYYALALRGFARAEEWVLVTGASGGVGTAAVQVAKGLGCRVVAQVSGEHRRPIAEAAGADATVLPHDLPTVVSMITDGAGVGVAIDVVGGDVTNLLRVLAPLGRLMVVGLPPVRSRPSE